MKIAVHIVTFRLPSLFLDDFLFSPSVGVWLVAAFPRMKFCGKIRNKNNEKSNIYGSYVVFYFYFVWLAPLGVTRLNFVLLRRTTAN
jgi:hypothetical protein